MDDAKIVNTMNVLKCVKCYSDLITNPSEGDFQYIENLEMGILYTTSGWAFYTFNYLPFQLIVLL